MTAVDRKNPSAVIESQIDAYLAAVRAAMNGVDPDIVDDTVEELRAHIGERLGADATLEDLSIVLDELGTADAFAPGETGAEPTSRGAGTVLGMPYDLRIPTTERVAYRWWNPSDPRVLMPRVFGVGWAVNFGAVAVRLNLIEPDAEEAPFAAVPQRAFVAALMVPVLLTGALVATFLWTRGALPARLPVHWAFSGQPDDFASQAAAFGFLFVMAGLPTVYAIATVALKRPPLNRGAAIAFAAFFSAIAASVWAITLVTVFTSIVSPWLPPLVILPAAFVVPAVVLVYLARTGRAAEIRSDLGR